ncbi:MAG: hypothetical protein K8R36_11270 [Planctomycetales bacterium]|nr:hypothetical protein [Planctomycetales bacterium]
MNRRQFFQISLRTLIGLMTVAAIWLGYVTHRAREQRAAVARIKELGGRVVYDYQMATTAMNPSPPGWPWLRRLIGDEYFQDVGRVSLQKTPASDADLAVICKLRRVQSIMLWQSNISDEGLASLESLTQLSSLDLRETKITSAGLARFKPPPTLSMLLLADIKISGGGARAIGRWSSLTFLNLDGTDVNAEDIQYLSELKNLQTLVISKTKLNDSAVSSLVKMTALVELYLTDSAISGEGLLALHDQLPKCRIDGPLVEVSNPHPLAISLESGRWKTLCSRFNALDTENNFKLLIFSGTPVTDAHLAGLKDLQHFEVIDLRNTKVTGAGIESLQRALPKCKIVR